MENAKKLFYEYLQNGLEMTPSFKGYGFKLIQFAADYPEEYKKLFLEKTSNENFDNYLKDNTMADATIPSIINTFRIDETKAWWLYKNIYLYVHGIATITATRGKSFSPEEISEMIGETCGAFLISLKTQEDGRTGQIPGVGITMSGNIEDYINPNNLLVRDTITGIGGDRGIHKVYLDEILYFEAVGELVFAYTKEQVYEIKKRLYQVETEVKDRGFIRASKSLLINIKEVKTIHPGMNRCMYAFMSNNEQLLITRNYAKHVVNVVKQLWDEHSTQEGETHV